jgi:hypothetical protein
MMEMGLRGWGRLVVVVCMSATVLLPLPAFPAQYAYPVLWVWQCNTGSSCPAGQDGRWVQFGAGVITTNWRNVPVLISVEGGNPVQPFQLRLYLWRGGRPTNPNAPLDRLTHLDCPINARSCWFNVAGKIDATWSVEGILYQRIGSPRPSEVSSAQAKATIAWGAGGGGVNARYYKCTPDDRIFFTVGAARLTVPNCKSGYLPVNNGDTASMQHVRFGTNLHIAAQLTGQLSNGWIMSVNRSARTAVCPPSNRSSCDVTVPGYTPPDPRYPIPESFWVIVNDTTQVNNGRGYAQITVLWCPPQHC